MRGHRSIHEIDENDHQLFLRIIYSPQESGGWRKMNERELYDLLGESNITYATLGRTFNVDA